MINRDEMMPKPETLEEYKARKAEEMQAYKKQHEEQVKEDRLEFLKRF